jgi:lipopolysaccharide transport system ATP-binding protein
MSSGKWQTGSDEMGKLAIRAEGLGKKFRLGERQRYFALRDALTRAVGAPFRMLSRLASGQLPFGGGERKEFWALSDVNFSIAPGEVVGLIGRNGAGKSTLLKILSRITEPTQGRALLRGRVGSLLEVGTGFHPELTGRENIFLNGAILGMRRREVRRKFDEIVAFAEVEQFIDTPVKQYSSGMYMRLAFAVAAQLEPEILLVDEVLAVGDSSFQKKCIGRMGEVGKEGRTVLFVSHSMTAITRLCPRAILLDGGRVIADGPAADVTAAYLRSDLGTMARRTWPDPATAPGDQVARLRAVSVIADDGASRATVDIRRPVILEMIYDVLRSGYIPVPNFHLYNEEGICVFVTGDTDPAWRRQPKPVGQYVSRVTVPGNFLSEGTLIVDAAISSVDPTTVHVHERETVAFQVIDSTDGDSLRGDYGGAVPGVVRPHLQWQTVTERARAPDKEGVP